MRPPPGRFLHPGATRRRHTGGFEAIGLSTGQHALLAHIRSRSRHGVGCYGIEVAALAQLVEPELGRPAGGVDLVVVDEVGKMELLCPQVVEVVPRLLDGPVLVVAPVAMRGGRLIAEAKARSDVRVVEVTAGNRGGLPGELDKWVRAWLPST